VFAKGVNAAALARSGVLQRRNGKGVKRAKGERKGSPFVFDVVLFGKSERTDAVGADSARLSAPAVPRR